MYVYLLSLHKIRINWSQLHLRFAIFSIVAVSFIGAFFSHLSDLNRSRGRPSPTLRWLWSTTNIWFSSLITPRIYLRGRFRSYFTLIDKSDSENPITRHLDLMRPLIFTNGMCAECEFEFLESPFYIKCINRN